MLLQQQNRNLKNSYAEHNREEARDYGYRSHIDSLDYCFQHPQWSKWVDFTVSLTQVFRQTDPIFINLLYKIRFGKLDQEDLSILQQKSIQGQNNLNKIQQLQKLKIKQYQDKFKLEQELKEQERELIKNDHPRRDFISTQKFNSSRLNVSINNLINSPYFEKDTNNSKRKRDQAEDIENTVEEEQGDVVDCSSDDDRCEDEDLSKDVKNGKELKSVITPNVIYKRMKNIVHKLQTPNNQNFNFIYFQNAIRPLVEKYLIPDLIQILAEYLCSEDLDQCIFMYATNREVDEKNQEQMNQCKNSLLQLYRVKYWDSVSLSNEYIVEPLSHVYTYTSYMNKAYGRNKILFEAWLEEQKRNNLAKPDIELTLGCKVMLTTNLNVSDGLSNGSMGKLVGFQLAETILWFVSVTSVANSITSITTEIKKFIL